MKKLRILIYIFFISLFAFCYNVKADYVDSKGKICSYEYLSSADGNPDVYAVVSEGQGVIGYSGSDISDSVINEISNWSAYISEKHYSVQCPKYIYRIQGESEPDAYATDNVNSIPEKSDIKYKLEEDGEHDGAFCYYLRNEGQPLYLLMDTEEEVIVNSKILEEDISKKLATFAKKSIEVNKHHCHSIMSCGKNLNMKFGLDYFDFNQKELKNCEVYYSSTAEKTDDECISYTSYKEKYDNAQLEVASCKDEDSVCKLEKTNELKTIKENWKSNCKSILEYGSYIDVDNCVIMCLELDDYLDEHDTSNTGECGFSGRLMVWFSNILRWIKYLLPVAVIVLAILDFIKAIGADKDDEMKKAQGRFVKRLIAAALVFIIPLIIEFVLDKMGFGYNDCGLF